MTSNEMRVVSQPEVVLLGDSIVKELGRYPNVDLKATTVNFNVNT